MLIVKKQKLTNKTLICAISDLVSVYLEGMDVVMSNCTVFKRRVIIVLPITVAAWSKA
jgi:hypothetical protein